MCRRIPPDGSTGGSAVARYRSQAAASQVLAPAGRVDFVRCNGTSRRSHWSNCRGGGPAALALPCDDGHMGDWAAATAGELCIPVRAYAGCLCSSRGRAAGSATSQPEHTYWALLRQGRHVAGRGWRRNLRGQLPSERASRPHPHARARGKAQHKHEHMMMLVISNTQTLSCAQQARRVSPG
jgi:hypothetical protein